jgi:hypothetical protein
MSPKINTAQCITPQYPVSFHVVKKYALFEVGTGFYVVQPNFTIRRIKKVFAPLNEFVSYVISGCGQVAVSLFIK